MVVGTVDKVLSKCVCSRNGMLQQRHLNCSLQIWGAGASCLDALSSSPITSVSSNSCLKIAHAVTPTCVAQDYIQTTVHVGCPPGMSLTFDPETSRSQFSQHCQSKTNVSCYYFNNSEYSSQDCVPIARNY